MRHLFGRDITRRDFVTQMAVAAGAAAIGCKEATDPGPISEVNSLDTFNRLRVKTG
jgi:protein-disulfide isomerase-like protein with CxxC motif